VIAAFVLAVQVAAQTAATLPRAAATARIPDGVGVHVAAAVVPETVVVGEQALYQVAVFVSEEVRSRLRRNPEFLPPELRGVLAYDPPGGYRLYQGVVRDERRWEVHVFQRAVFPLGAGAVRIPEARLSYALPTSSSFFAREETVALQAQAVTLVAVDPPRDGRPAAWGGAVGDLSVTASLDAPRVRVGDPLTLSVRVRGVGNVNLFPRPAVTLPWGDVVAGGEEVRLDSVPLLVRGEKRFEWIVTPRREGRLVIPPIRLAYWEPRSRTWRTAETSPLALEAVAGGAGVAAPAAPTDAGTAASAGAVADTVPRLPMTWRGAAAPPVHRRWAFWLLALLAPAPALWALTRRRPMVDAAAAGGERRAGDRSPAAPATANGRGAAPTAANAFASWRAALAAHVALPVGAGELMVVQALRRAGVTDATARRAAAFDAGLQQAAYGGRPAPRESDADVLAAVRREVRRAAQSRGGDARRDRRAWWRLGRVLAVAALGLGALRPAAAQPAAASDEAATRYAAGVAAWKAGLTGDARRAFADAAALEPRAARAWEALGVAAFAEADTAVAIMAWQRAARLAPYGRAVRTRLAPFLDTSRPVWSPAFLPPYDASLWALAALAAWLAGWGAAAWRLRRGRRSGAPAAWRGPALVGAIVAVACAGVAAWTEHQLAGRDLVVARRDVRLRAVPALGGDPVAAVQVGEVVRVLERREGWRRVRLADARDGWIEDGELLGIARPD
jgi:hypothetical protein